VIKINKKKQEELINLLQEDSRQNITELSRKLRTSVSKIFDAIKEIRKEYKFTIVKIE